MSRLCLHEENCRSGTEVSVKITCRIKEIMLKKALMWPIVETKRSGEERSGGGEWGGVEWRSGVEDWSGGVITVGVTIS